MAQTGDRLAAIFPPRTVRAPDSDHDLASRLTDSSKSALSYPVT
jgi:hypothetical protein